MTLAALTRVSPAQRMHGAHARFRCTRLSAWVVDQHVFKQLAIKAWRRVSAHSSQQRAAKRVTTSRCEHRVLGLQRRKALSGFTYLSQCGVRHFVRYASQLQDAAPRELLYPKAAPPGAPVAQLRLAQQHLQVAQQLPLRQLARQQQTAWERARVPVRQTAPLRRAWPLPCRSASREGLQIGVACCI